MANLFFLNYKGGAHNMHLFIFGSYRVHSRRAPFGCISVLDTNFIIDRRGILYPTYCSVKKKKIIAAT